MPGGFPLGLEVCNPTDNGTVTASSVGTTITSGAANTKGSWTQLTASLPFDCCWVLIEGVAGNTRTIYDIGVGAPGSEKVIVSNLYAGTTSQPNTWAFPLSIPSGTPVSARSQALNATVTSTIRFTGFDGSITSLEGIAGADGLGITTSNTTSTTLTANASANTKATSYTTIVASTARDYLGLVVNLQPSQTTASLNYLVDIAIGAASSEINIIPNCFLSNNTATAAMKKHFIIPIPIPSGTRISGRCQCSTGSDSVLVDLLGLYQ